MVFSNVRFSFVKALMLLLVPLYLDRNDQFFEVDLLENYININNPRFRRRTRVMNNIDPIQEVDEEIDEEEEFVEVEEGNNPNLPFQLVCVRNWYLQDIDSGVTWSLDIERVEHHKQTEKQDVSVIVSKRFGKGIVCDGHLKNSEHDDFVYHENLVHPALLLHNEPKTVFIMGGGGGSAAREVLKYRSIEKVVMCDIDKELVNWCRENNYMMSNNEAFNDQRLHIVYNDAKDELEKSIEKFDVIIGDISDPYQSSHSNKLYTKSFYEHVVKPKLQDNGLFVTQAGPAGILSHKAVFAPVFNTMKQVFTALVPYTAHIASYGDLCGWIIASNSNEGFCLNCAELNRKIAERIKGELSYLDGGVICASAIINKTLKNSLMEETRIWTEENVNAGFIHCRGIREI